jgi:hypothetical protein
MPQNPAYLSVSRKALEKIWQLEDILLLLVFNRKTSNVNMGAKLSVGQILLWKSLNRLLCCQIYIIGKQILLWKIGPVPARRNGV